MFIRLGYEIGISCDQPTPMMTFLSVDRARRHDIVSERGPISDPVVKMGEVTDPFGNVCMRMVVPAGGLRLSYDAVIKDSGRPDPVNRAAQQVPVENLPAECLPYLSASRYCETDRFGRNCLASVRRSRTGLGPCPGNLRLCASAPDLQLWLHGDVAHRDGGA